MPICKVCGKEIPYGKSYKDEHFKNEKFCSAECYTERLNTSTRLNSLGWSVEDAFECGKYKKESD